MRVYNLVVFDSGDITTSVWGVYKEKEKAEKRKNELLESDLNKDGYYLNVRITEHEVE